MFQAAVRQQQQTVPLLGEHILHRPAAHQQPHPQLHPHRPGRPRPPARPRHAPRLHRWGGARVAATRLGRGQVSLQPRI